MKEDLICGVAILLYVLYEYEEKPYIRSSVSLEDIVKKYILITDVKHK